MSKTIFFVKGEIRREVFPSQTGTIALLKRAGFTQVVEESAQKEEAETPDFWEKLGESLAAAGFDSPDAVLEATDDELMAVDGIGEATVKKIREQLQ